MAGGRGVSGESRRVLIFHQQGFPGLASESVGYRCLDPALDSHRTVTLIPSRPPSRTQSPDDTSSVEVEPGYTFETSRLLPRRREPPREKDDEKRDPQAVDDFVSAGYPKGGPGGPDGK